MPASRPQPVTRRYRPQPVALDELAEVLYRVLMDTCRICHMNEHTRADRPILLLKEGIDNVLDACVAASIAPRIAVSVDERRLVISDNGPGLPPDFIERIVDLDSRTSDKAAYVSRTEYMRNLLRRNGWKGPA
jgi:signal transduction histidine kinase